MRKLGKLFLCAMFVMCAVLLAAQETVSADDVDALTLEMDGLLKERSTLEKKEASVLKTIEDGVSSYQKGELAKRYAELEQYKDYFEAQEYQDARAEEERQVAALAQEERIRLEQNAKPELDEISQKKNELTEKIQELEKVLLNRTYKIHTSQVVEKKYDKTDKAIKISFGVPVFLECYDVTYSFDITGLTPYEIVKKGAEEEEKDYSADVCYTVTKEDGADFYVVTVTSMDVYSADGEKIVSDFKLDKAAKKFSEGEFFFNVAKIRINDGFVFVEGGTFDMGSNDGDSDEKPVHSVTISDFYICDHEVTQAEYKALMGKVSGYYKGDELPVDSVSWYGAVEYCNKLSRSKGLTPCYSLNGTTDTSKWGERGKAWNDVSCDFLANGYRLPTEAEWEYAARGGNKSKGYTYSGSNDINSVALNGGDSGRNHYNVKTKQPNEIGIYDMSGNVGEWCWDWYEKYSSGTVTNPVGPTSGKGRIYRGGEGRVSNRSYSDLVYEYYNFGFRVVRTDVEYVDVQAQSKSAAEIFSSVSYAANDDFVFVESGTFSMGSNSGDSDEKPVHSVTVSGFYMSDHEVTQAEYKAITGNNPSESVGDNKPVEKVSWYDAILYCNKLSEMKGLTPCYIINGENVSCDFTANGYRLPTEAEWEYAAREGNKSKGYTYSGSSSVENVAWYTDNSKKQTHDVRNKNANGLGLYDMSGNVWEWCWDFYGDYNSDWVQVNPTGALSGANHVRRGGSWYSGGAYCSVSVRSGRASDYSDGLTGFRVVRSADDRFVFVEGSTFDMGSTSGYSVTVSDFYMSDHEVTQAEYKAVTGKNPSYFKGDNRPVEQVSWNDAVEYCNKLSEMKGLTPCYKTGYGNVIVCDFAANGYRLPTEAEWEYAARGGNKSNEYEYSGSNSVGLVAWYGREDRRTKGNSNSQTHAVKEKQPNELGIYDMSGNVWEWCWDWYEKYSSGAVTNPHGASSGSYRVMRGGCWDSLDSFCRVAYRSSYTPDSTGDYLGFRVVRSSSK